MTTPVLVASSGDDGNHHMMIIGHEGESCLSKLSGEQRQALNDWTMTQPLRDGIVDLMAWPGWAEVIMSRLENSLLNEGGTNKPVTLDEYHKFGPDPAVEKSRKLYQEFCADRQARTKSAQ